MPYKNIIIAIFLSLLSLTTRAQSKLSPFVRRAVQAEYIRTSRARHIQAKANLTHQRTITAFVRTSDTDALRTEGCHIYAQWDDIVIASIPLNKVTTLASNPKITRIEAGRSCSITNDTTSLITHARDAWNLTTTLPHPCSSLTGQGVVVGVMDVGFDLTHPTFYSSDMSQYRIRAFWDQLDTLQTGSPLIGKTAQGLDTIYIGRQYTTQDAILTKAHATDGLICTHGTHTTGTAAGSGSEGNSTNTCHPSSNTYSGMAPSSDICLVCNYAGDNDKVVSDSLKDQYTTATDMLGFKYIFDYADSQGKPCVINFSEGAHDDFHDSQLYSEVLSKMIGPGHILCCAAGNEAWHNNYVSKPLGTDYAGAFLTSSTKNAYYTLCSTRPARFTITFYPAQTDHYEFNYDTATMIQYPDSDFTDTITINDQRFSITLTSYPSCFDSSKYATELAITNLQDSTIEKSIPISITLLDANNSIEAFSLGGYFSFNSLNTSLNNADNTHCILFPASAKDVIGVGNVAYRQGFYNYEGTWRDPFHDGTKDGIISIYSSRGPTINGLIKPDVCAPGMNIISAFSSYYREVNPTSDLVNEARQFTYNGRHYSWEANSGTSMSSPVVVGIIALWLQICPTLTPDQIRDVFAHSCTHFDESLSYPNNIYGYGTIDALAGLNYIQHTYTGIEEIHTSTPKNQNSIYSLDGRKMSTSINRHGIFIISDANGTRKVVR